MGEGRCSGRETFPLSGVRFLSHVFCWLKTRFALFYLRTVRLQELRNMIFFRGKKLTLKYLKLAHGLIVFFWVLWRNLKIVQLRTLAERAFFV